MTNDSQNSVESNKLFENKKNSMDDDAKIRLKNVKSKVDKAISCSSLLLEIYRDNLKHIENAKNNEISVKLKNNNININETSMIVRNYMLDEMQVIFEKTEDKKEKIDKLEKILRKLQSELNEENKNEIVEESNIHKAEINNIELAFRIDVDLMNEYKRFATFIINLK